MTDFFPLFEVSLMLLFQLIFEGGTWWWIYRSIVSAITCAYTLPPWARLHVSDTGRYGLLLCFSCLTLRSTFMTPWMFIRYKLGFLALQTEFDSNSWIFESAISCYCGNSCMVGIVTTVPPGWCRKRVSLCCNVSFVNVTLNRMRYNVIFTWLLLCTIFSIIIFCLLSQKRKRIIIWQCKLLQLMSGSLISTGFHSFCHAPQKPYCCNDYSPQWHDLHTSFGLQLDKLIYEICLSALLSPSRSALVLVSLREKQRTISLKSWRFLPQCPRP